MQGFLLILSDILTDRNGGSVLSGEMEIVNSVVSSVHRGSFTDNDTIGFVIELFTL